MLRTSLGFLVSAGLGSVAFAQGVVAGPVWSGAYEIGDANADGRAETMVRDVVTNVFRVFDGATGAPLAYLQRTGGTYGPVGDQDGDGCDDLAHNDGTTVTVVSGFDGSTLQTLVGAFARVGGADVDGDGRSDLLLQEVAQMLPPVDRYMSCVSSRTGTLLWQQSVGHAFSGFTAGGLEAIGDENGDGLEDVVFGVSVTVPILAPSTRLVRGPATMLTLDRWQPVGDVDGDGRIDGLTQSSVTFAWQLVGGGSGATLWAPSLVGPTVRRLDDVDGDGHADFFLVDAFASIPAQVVSGATFQPLPGFVPGPPSDIPFAIGDIDGDGRREFVAGGVEQQWVDAAVPVASRMARRGTPGTTNDGRRPKVVARGHAGLGNTVFLDVRGALPNGLVLLLFGGAADVDLGPIGAPGNRSYTTVDGALGLLAGGSGVAQFQAVMPVSPSLLGVSIRVQAAVVDGLANGLGLVLSSALDVTTSN